MAVKIRLSRKGRKQNPIYDIVVADVRAPRDGRFIEKLGQYNPTSTPAGLTLKKERALYWLMVGAQPTDTTRKILSVEGVMFQKHLQVGVLKGAITQEDADKKLEAWLKDKAEKREARKEKIKKDNSSSKIAKLEAEKAKKEAKEAAALKAREEALKAAEAAENPQIDEVEETATQANEEAVEAISNGDADIPEVDTTVDEAVEAISDEAPAQEGAEEKSPEEEA